LFCNNQPSKFYKAKKHISKLFEKKRASRRAIAVALMHKRQTLTLPSSHITHHTHAKWWWNRQARVALGDRIRNSLQLTALRLNPCRLQGVQALTMHYPWLTINNIESFVLESILLDTCDMYSTEDKFKEWIWWVQEHRNAHAPVHYNQYNVRRAFIELLFWHGYDLRGVQA
jgi:hypothetical protein